MSDSLTVILGGAALGLSVLILVIVVIVVPAICCLLCKARKEIRILRSYQNRLNSVENGKKDRFPVLQEYNEEPSRFSASYPEPQASPQHTNPRPIPSNYDRVNIGSFLPDEVRTPENLEPGVIPEGKAGELLIQRHLKQQVAYEQREIKETVKPTIGEGERAIPPAYDDIELSDDYFNPVDAVAKIRNPLSTAVSRGPNTGNTTDKKFQSPSSAPRPEEYSDVFDCLPQGHMERVSGPEGREVIKTGRVFSDSSPLPTRKAGEMIGGYEDVGLTEEVGVVPKPGSLPAGSISHLAEEDSPGSPRRFTMPGVKRHKSSRDDKEMVSFDRKTNKYMTESMRKKKKERVTMTNGDDSAHLKLKEQELETEMVDSNGTADPDSYALVSLADKQQYRAEEDNMKKEGSGTPTHYRASKTSPVKTVEGETTGL